jgi:dsDNA-binding SOS-regulon protein
MLFRQDMSNFVGKETETLICLLKDYKENALIESHEATMGDQKMNFLVKISADYYQSVLPG